MHMARTVTHLPLSVTEKTSRKPSPVLMYCSLMAPNSSCPAVSRTRRARTHTSTQITHTITGETDLHNQFLEYNAMQQKRTQIALRACVFVSLYLFLCVVFVRQSALTVEPGRPFVNHTLLGVGVFNRGVIVGDKVRLREREREERTKERGDTVNMPEGRHIVSG